MAMSRKNYRGVAEIINAAGTEHFDSELSPWYVQGWILSYVAAGLASLFAEDNERFDRERFMEACFPTPTE